MKGTAKTKLELLKALVKSGARIFTYKQALKLAVALGIPPKNLKNLLYTLKKDKWIQSLKRGVYAITLESGFEPVPHEYEIATSLASPSAIGFWSAFHYHHLTQQIPLTIYVLIPTGTSIPRNPTDTNIRFVQVKSSHYFGIEKVWIGESQIQITDPERTLLDGISRPQYCGDFQEVLHAFVMYGKKLNLEKIINYACRLEIVIAKRLGFILDQLGYPIKKLKPLIEIPIKGVQKLDPNGLLQGPINKRWQIKENIGRNSGNTT